MLAGTNVQPRVLVALIIQCATMATTEVVEGDNFDESSEVEEDSTLLQGEIGSSDSVRKSCTF